MTGSTWRWWAGTNLNPVSACLCDDDMDRWPAAACMLHGRHTAVLLLAAVSTSTVSRCSQSYVPALLGWLHLQLTVHCSLQLHAGSLEGDTAIHKQQCSLQLHADFLIIGSSKITLQGSTISQPSSPPVLSPPAERV